MFNNTSSSNGYTVAGSTGNTLGGVAGVNGGTLTVQVTNSGASDTISAPIVSQLIKTGNGTLIVSGGAANTFGGGGTGIAINGGTLQGDAVSLAGATTINNYAALVFNQGAGAAYNGTITGGGSVTVQGGAFTLTLGGTNTYSGGTTITGGMTVAVSNNANLGDAGGGLTLNNGNLNTIGRQPPGFANSRFLTVRSRRWHPHATPAAGSVNTFNGAAAIRHRRNAHRHRRRHAANQRQRFDPAPVPPRAPESS